MNASRQAVVVAVVFAAVLGGCSVISTMNETSRKMVNKLTGADDPNDQSLTAQAGRMQNAGMDMAAGAVGIKPEPAAAGQTAVTRSDPEIVAGPPTTSNAQQASTDRPHRPLSKDLIAKVQAKLKELGFDPEVPTAPLDREAGPPFDSSRPLATYG